MGEETQFIGQLVSICARQTGTSQHHIKFVVTDVVPNPLPKKFCNGPVPETFGHTRAANFEKLEIAVALQQRAEFKFAF